MSEDDDRYWDYDCDNCGGEGFVYGCSWDWQCDTYDEGEGTCLCTRACHICNPAKPTPETEALRAVLGEFLAKVEPCLKPGCANPRGTVCTHTLCHGRGYGQHLYAQGIEAGTAETERLGPQGESPVPNGDAP